VRHDLGRIAGDGLRIAGLERPITAELIFGDPKRRIVVRGRIDRLLRDRDGGLLITDYKTGGRPAMHVDMAAVLKGHRLQIPLYVLLAEAPEAGLEPVGTARGEVLGVGPAFTTAVADADERRAGLDSAKFALHRAGFEETVGVLADLAADGRFPLNADNTRFCGYCPYLRACRRLHAPTLARLDRTAALEDYRLLQDKSTRAPTLAGIRAKRDGKETP
jgi:hypothetical protein